MPLILCVPIEHRNRIALAGPCGGNYKPPMTSSVDFWRRRCGLLALTLFTFFILLGSRSLH